MSSKTLQIPGVMGRPDNLLWVDPAQVSIVPGENPRDEDLALEDLKPLIAEQGFRLDRPISVFRDDDNALKLIDGQRRLLSVLALIEEGQSIPRIPAILLPRMADPVERLLSALAANRGKELLPTEEARAFQRLMNYGWTEDRIAKAVGHGRFYVRARLALLDAKPIVMEALHNGDISVSTAVSLVKHAERDGVPQATKLEEHKAQKATQPTRQKRTTEEKITLALARLEDECGYALVQETAKKRYC